MMICLATDINAEDIVNEKVTSKSYISNSNSVDGFDAVGGV